MAKQPTQNLPAKQEEKNYPAVLSNYALMTPQGAEALAVMRENLGSSGVTSFDLDRIKMPNGGGVFFQVPSLEGEKAEKEIEGVILAWADRRAYWMQSFDETGGGTPPDCASNDSQTGTGTPGGSCLNCPLAQFGSAAPKGDGGEKGRGQACRQFRVLLILRPGGVIPQVIQVPPTSLQEMKKYFLRMSSEGRVYSSVVTKLTLKEDKNKDGIKYSQIVPSFVSRIEGDELKAIKKHADTFQAAIHTIASDYEDVTGRGAQPRQ